uniref:Uncharacterized protein n=1 Tax=Magallana gigas TaxID=29159 RepID=K1QJB6_MAGGI
MKEKGDHKVVKDKKDHHHHHKDKNTHIPRITTRPLIMATDTRKAQIRVPRMRLTRVARGLSHTGIPRIRSLPVKAMPSTPLLGQKDVQDGDTVSLLSDSGYSTKSKKLRMKKWTDIAYTHVDEGYMPVHFSKANMYI